MSKNKFYLQQHSGDLNAYVKGYKFQTQKMTN
jgi:hypothetical protein